MKTSDLLVRCLENEGVDVIFGVPGEENADFMMSLEGSSIQFVLCRHEQGAAFMAEIYGKLTGQAAGALGTLGPGATNLLTAVADADMDHAPMIVLTGQGGLNRHHKESHQVMDVVEMYKPVTKWAVSITDPKTTPEIVRKALRTARREKPGAVLIELPEDVAKRDAGDVSPLPVRHFRRPAQDDKILDRAHALLRDAKSPVVIAGNGAIRRRVSAQLRAFCEATGIGVMSTFMGKGAVDWREEYALLTIGLGKRDFVADAVDGADVVICLGYDLVEYPPQKWNPKNDKAILHIDFEPAEIDAHYIPELELVGDVGHALWGLNERIARDGSPVYDLNCQRDVRRRMLAEFEAHRNQTGGPIKPQKAIWDVRQALGPSDILITGVGAHKMWAGRLYPCVEPNTCLIPNGFCSMGPTVPGVVAAHMVHPDRRILAIAGDGDFMMNVQEMETARRLNTDAVVLVWEDGGYGLISWKQDDEFDRHTQLSFGNPDWLKLADAFGWFGQRVDRAEDLRDGLERAFEYKGPALVVIPIDYAENRLLSQRLGAIEIAS